MKYTGKKIFIIITATLFIMVVMVSHLWAAAPEIQDQEILQPVDSAAKAVTEDTADSRLNRIDFGNTYIIGQSIKSGAVYLLQRKKSEIKSMLKYREDYRDEILEGFVIDAPVDMTETKEGARTARSDRLVTQE